MISITNWPAAAILIAFGNFFADMHFDNNSGPLPDYYNSDHPDSGKALCNRNSKNCPARILRSGLRRINTEGIARILEKGVLITPTYREGRAGLLIYSEKFLGRNLYMADQGWGYLHGNYKVVNSKLCVINAKSNNYCRKLYYSKDGKIFSTYKNVRELVEISIKPN